MILSALLLIAQATCLPVKRTVASDEQSSSNYDQSGTSYWRRQDGTNSFFQLNLVKKGLNYFTTFGVGTPQDSREFMVVTGSGDLWVNAEPTHRRKFKYKNSQTFKADANQPQFSVEIGNYGYATGFWGSDIISAFGSQFEAPFGIATESNMAENLGLGPSRGSFNHSSFTQTLKNKGMIKSNSYSLWLEGAERSDNYGLLFGAVDHSKYEGTLTSLPIVGRHSPKDRSSPSSLSVMLNALRGYIEPGVLVVETNQPILIDSGSAFSQLPDAFVDTLGGSLNGEFSKALNLYVVDCQTKGQITFEFSGHEIDFPLSDFLVPSGNRNSLGKCSLSFQKQGNGSMVVGGTMLRKLYLVVDIDRSEIALAKAVNADQQNQPNLEIIETGIPRATPAANYSPA